MTIFLFILIFGGVVLSHEFGHYIIARKNGIRVLEFSIGMGPTLLHFDRKGVRYALRLFPIGGACMFDGESDLPPKLEELARKYEGENLGCAFSKASVWGRIATVFAGPFFNLILGFLIALILVAYTGTDLPIVQKVEDHSAAQEAGMQDGDRIVSLDGESVNLYREVRMISAMNRDGDPLEVSYERDGQIYDVVITPKYDEEAGRYFLGFMGGGAYQECKGFSVFKYGYYETRYVFRNTLKSLWMLVTGQLTRNDVSGPVGIASYVGETYEEVKEYGILTVVMTMLNFVLLLSVNLGIMNLLPLPALDGGRLVFLFLELVRGKPVSQEKEGMVHLAGFVMFLALMVFVMYNDIMRLF